MDLIRQYIVQCITAAANNLRLNTEKIEVVSLLRESICKAENIENEIRNMKKITELSTFAIKLGEIYNYIAKSKIDFLKVSDKYKEHCFSLVKDLSSVLDKISPQSFRNLTNSMKETSTGSENILDSNNSEKKAIIEETPEEIKDDEGLKNLEILENRAKIERTGDIEIKNQPQSFAPVKGNEEIKEEFLLDTGKKASPILFENYEERILAPIKEIDSFLKNVSQSQASKEDLLKYYEIIRENAQLSASIGFDIIAGMHRIFAKALKLICDEQLVADKDIIAGMRASLIVIVAVIRGKEVDLTGYLNKAEELGKRIQNLK